MSTEPGGRLLSAPVATTLAIAAIAGYAAVAGTVLAGQSRGIVSVALIGVLLGLTWSAGLGLDDLGLGRAQLAAGLRWGAMAALIAVAGIVLAASLPGTRSFFTDERVAGDGFTEVFMEATVRIPVGTAMFEELVFRGSLLALLLAGLRPVVATGVSSLLFGLWHVAPALAFADTNSGVPGSGAGVDLLVVAATVVFTGVAGGLLTWLRLRSGSLVAPVILHAAVNSTALVVAWMVST